MDTVLFNGSLNVSTFMVSQFNLKSYLSNPSRSFKIETMDTVLFNGSLNVSTFMVSQFNLKSYLSDSSPSFKIEAMDAVLLYVSLNVYTFLTHPVLYMDSSLLRKKLHFSKLTILQKPNRLKK